jgi:hypothetical protein
LNNLPGQWPGCGESLGVTALVVLLPKDFLYGPRPAPLNSENQQHGISEVEMANYKEKAIGILFVLGSILVLMATWDLPENHPPQLQ